MLDDVATRAGGAHEQLAGWCRDGLGFDRAMAGGPQDADVVASFGEHES